jgi:hypothetical protein
MTRRKKKAAARPRRKGNAPAEADVVDNVDGGSREASPDFDALEKEVRGGPAKQAKEKPPPQAAQLLALADSTEYCHDPEGRSYARLTVDGAAGPHQETWPVRSGGFRDWLCRQYYISTGGKAPSAQALEESLNVLAARGRYDGPTREVFVRVGRTTPDAICIDLGDPCWRCVVITPDGWSISTTSPVYFRRPKGLLRLPEPVRGGQLDELRQYINLDPAHWPLVVGWLIASLFPNGPFPVCCLHGDQGAAKSTAARVLRALIDPSKAPLRGVPRDERDIVISASNSWVLALDNLSVLHDWLSDALCRVATGGGFSTRELYSDDEEAIFDVQRPCILTGIEDLASRPDLTDRAVILHHPKIKDDSRLTEAQFWQRFEQARPRILGALFDVLAGTLRHLPGVHLTALPRMADFAIRAVAACRALNWPDDEFIDAYADNQADAISASLEESILNEPLNAFLARTYLPWEGNWQQLLDGLTTGAGEKAKSLKWPKDTRQLSGMFRRLAPNLRRSGLEVDMSRRSSDHRRERRVRIERLPENRRKSPSGSSDTSCKERFSDAPDVSDGDLQTHSGACRNGFVEGVIADLDAGDGRGDAYDGD